MYREQKPPERPFLPETLLALLSAIYASRLALLYLPWDGIGAEVEAAVAVSLVVGALLFLRRRDACGSSSCLHARGAHLLCCLLCQGRRMQQRHFRQQAPRSLSSSSRETARKGRAAGAAALRPRRMGTLSAMSGLLARGSSRRGSVCAASGA